MFLGQLFKANPNFANLETLTFNLRDQEYLENSMVMINNFLDQFFTAYPNFVILETFTGILRDQVYFENYMVMD